MPTLVGAAVGPPVPVAVTARMPVAMAIAAAIPGVVVAVTVGVALVRGRSPLRPELARLVARRGVGVPRTVTITARAEVVRAGRGRQAEGERRCQRQCACRPFHRLCSFRSAGRSPALAGTIGRRA
jgi:hypothetical protein